MALGPTHRRFNLFTGVIFFVIVMIATKLDWECMGCFTIAFVLGTFIISPDIDLGPISIVDGLGFLFIHTLSYSNIVVCLTRSFLELYQEYCMD